MNRKKVWRYEITFERSRGAVIFAQYGLSKNTTVIVSHYKCHARMLKVISMLSTQVYKKSRTAGVRE